jgi:hypothetical protein
MVGALAEYGYHPPDQRVVPMGNTGPALLLLILRLWFQSIGYESLS